MSIETNELSVNAKGGTEMMMEKLHSSFEKEYLDQFQIIPSRVRELNDTKYRIYYAHDLAEDPEAEKALRVRNATPEMEGWQRFHHLVFVSYWQREKFIERYRIPRDRTSVIKNAITPFHVADDAIKEFSFKPTDKINLIYHTTPHRGLEILVPVFNKLAEEYGDRIHLDVFSSFEIYGWKNRDEPYEKLFDEIKNHPNMTYHGYQPNEVVRKYLLNAHIFAFPSQWEETSCIALMEAMAAGCLCVHSDLAALPETAANWTVMYPYYEDKKFHSVLFYNVLRRAVDFWMDPTNDVKVQLLRQHIYSCDFYSWDRRVLDWKGVLDMVKSRPLELENPKNVVTVTMDI